MESLIPSQGDLDMDLLAPSPCSWPDQGTQVAPRTAKEFLDEGWEGWFRVCALGTVGAPSRHQRLNNSLLPSAPSPPDFRIGESSTRP
jgi:hypothetical protein